MSKACSVMMVFLLRIIFFSWRLSIVYLPIVFLLPACCACAIRVGKKNGRDAVSPTVSSQLDAGDQRATTAVALLHAARCCEHQATKPTRIHPRRHHLRYTKQRFMAMDQNQLPAVRYTPPTMHRLQSIIGVTMNPAPQTLQPPTGSPINHPPRTLPPPPRINYPLSSPSPSPSPSPSLPPTPLPPLPTWNPINQPPRTVPPPPIKYPLPSPSPSIKPTPLPPPPLPPSPSEIDLTYTQSPTPPSLSAPNGQKTVLLTMAPTHHHQQEPSSLSSGANASNDATTTVPNDVWVSDPPNTLNLEGTGAVVAAAAPPPPSPSPTLRIIGSSLLATTLVLYLLLMVLARRGAAKNRQHHLSPAACRAASTFRPAQGTEPPLDATL